MQSKDIGECDMLKITLELGVEEIERRIERTHKVLNRTFYLRSIVHYKSFEQLRFGKQGVCMTL